MDEVWRVIPGHGCLYEASSLGHIRRLAYRGTDGRRVPGRVLVGANSRGYRVVGTRHGTRAVHRLVCWAFHGPPPDGSNVVRHLNGDPADNRPSNLKWGTALENVADTTAMGRNSRSARSHCPGGHEHAAFNNTKQASKRDRRDCKSCARAASWARVRGLDPRGPETQRYADSQFDRLRNEA